MNREEQGSGGGTEKARGVRGALVLVVVTVGGGRGWLGVLRPVAKNSAAVAPATGLARTLRPGLEREIIGGGDMAERERENGRATGGSKRAVSLPVLSIFLSVCPDGHYR